MGSQLETTSDGRASAPRWPARPFFAYALLGLAAVLLYAQTISFGLLSYDDPWLVRDNTIVQRQEG